MFVGFLGAPNSGKTTIAAQVFAELKKSGQPNVEFVVEEARRYIAEKSYETRNPGTFSDDDQIAIFRRQMKSELVMHTAVGHNGIVVSDSCALNSLWYMSGQVLQTMLYHNTETDEYLEWLKREAMLFYCPIVGIHTNDNLRIHSKHQGQEIDSVCSGFIINHKKWLPLTAQLSGPIDFRTNKVVEKIYERLMQ